MKLFKLKEWVTVADAAKRLTTSLGENISEADVLRLALDGHLKLSVHFVNGAQAKPGKFVPIAEAEWVETVSPVDGVTPFRFIRGEVFYDRNGQPVRVLQAGKNVMSIRGVFDLSMQGGERHDVEHEYQRLTGGPAVSLVSLDGAFVECDGLGFQLQERFDKAKSGMDGYYPAGGLPDDSVLVVRTKALLDFESSLIEADTEGKPLTTTERNTLLRLVIGMAVAAYRYDAKASKSPIPKEIADDLSAHGLNVSDDTVRKYLKEAVETVLPARPRQS